MPSNVEIKARAQDPERIKRLAAGMADEPGEEFGQLDVFFPTQRGRLKLRFLGPKYGELIYYERADTAGPRACAYQVTPTTDPWGVRAMLSAALGVRGVVEKRRRLFIVGQTRVHLDTVKGLGDFVEFEVVLRDDQTPEDGRIVARALMGLLGILEQDLIAESYIDLVAPGV